MSCETWLHNGTCLQLDFEGSVFIKLHLHTRFMVDPRDICFVSVSVSVLYHTNLQTMLPFSNQVRSLE